MLQDMPSPSADGCSIGVIGEDYITSIISTGHYSKALCHLLVVYKAFHLVDPCSWLELYNWACMHDCEAWDTPAQPVPAT